MGKASAKVPRPVASNSAAAGGDGSTACASTDADDVAVAWYAMARKCLALPSANMTSAATLKILHCVVWVGGAARQWGQQLCVCEDVWHKRQADILECPGRCMGGG